MDLARYLADRASRIDPNTARTLRYRVGLWGRLLEGAPLTPESFDEFRQKARDCGYSPRTIESTVDAMRLISADNGPKPHPGNRLVIPAPCPDVPTLEQVGAIYSSSNVAIWPRRLSVTDRHHWWRAWIVVAAWTGLRLEDLGLLAWSDIQGGWLKIVADKTRRFGRPPLLCPLPVFVRRHLELMPQCGPTVFRLTTCYRQLRRELQRIAGAAKAPYVPPHGFRRYAISQWAVVDRYAAMLVQGQSLGSVSHYLDVGRILERVAKSVDVPREWLTDAERQQIAAGETRLLDRFRAAPPEQRERILRLIDQLR